MSGQVALVTGASRGIGRAIAEALAAGGASVVVNYRQEQAAAEQVVQRIEASGGQAIAVRADVGEVTDCEALMKAALERFGRVDILVNNAGNSLEKLLLDTDLGEWERLMAVHLRATYLLSRLALVGMAQRKYGRIITVSSIWGISGGSGEVAYSAAKAGQIGFTKALAQEVGPWGITVNAVAPGAIETEMNASLTGSALADWLDRTPVGRLGSVEEVAEVVRFLARPGAGFITGQVISPNGGTVV